MWYVYILQCSDNTLYTGITTDLAKRVILHNAKKGAKYTAQRGPVNLVWHETCASESIARKREAALKKLSRTQKLKLITGQ